MGSEHMDQLAHMTTLEPKYPYPRALKGALLDIFQASPRGEYKLVLVTKAPFRLILRQ
jgi:hypothetical protein